MRTTLGLVLFLALLAPARVARAQTAPRCASTAAPREGFDDFFRRFARDSAFQHARIRFPLPWYAAADERHLRRTARDWEFVPLLGEGETYTRVFDDFHMRERDGDERVFAVVGVASDIRQNWFFQRRCGRWALVKVEDLSM